MLRTAAENSERAALKRANHFHLSARPARIFLADSLTHVCLGAAVVDGFSERACTQDQFRR
jgi:hypothetical protein